MGRTHACTQTHIVVFIHYTSVSAAYMWVMCWRWKAEIGWHMGWAVDLCQAGFKDIVGWLGVHTPTRGDTVWIVRGRRVSVISGKVMVRGAGAGHKAIWLPLDIGVTTLLAWWRRHWRQSPRNRLPCVGALLSGLELSWLHGTGGLEQRWPLTGSVSVLDVALQPAGALGSEMQRVPVHVLFQCTTVSGKGRGVVYSPHIFTLAHLQERDVWRRYSSLQVVLSHGRNHCWSC